MRCSGALYRSLLLLFILYLNSAAVYAYEYHVRPLILPSGSVPISEEILQVRQGDSPALDHLAAENGIQALRINRSVFGEDASLVPLWQIRSLFPVLQAPTKGGQGDEVEQMIALVGKSSIYIPGTIQDKTRRQILQHALEHLSKSFNSRDLRIELSLSRVPYTLQEADVLSVDLIGGSKRSGDIRLMCTALKDGRKVEAVVSGKMNVSSPFPVAPTSLQAGEIFRIEDLALKAFPEDSLREGEILPDAGAFVAKRDIEKGEIISRNNAKPKLSVLAGDEVTVILRNGAVSLRVQGTARGNGRTGDIIPVRLNTGVIRDCKIENEGELILEK